MQDETERLTVTQAAARLGVSPDAIRKRIRRGTLTAYKVDGEWQVSMPIVLSPGQDTPAETVPANVQDAARDAIAYLENERDRLLRDNDRLLTTVAGLEETVRTQSRTIEELSRRVPELPAAAPVPEHTHSAAQMAATPSPRRLWWRRLLGR